MTKKKFKKKWLPLLKKIGFKESFEEDIDHLAEQSFDDGFGSGYEEARIQVKYFIEDMGKNEDRA